MNSKRPDLNEIATTLDGRDITRGFLNPLMPQLPDDPVLLERGGGDYQLYREVLRDDHVKAAVEQRRRAVIACPWEVKPGGSRAIDKSAADFLKENIEALGWDILCEKMLMGIFYGFAVSECLYVADGRTWRLDAVKVRDRRRFAFDGADRLRLKTMQQPMGELLPEKKFWTFVTGADHDDAPYGLGLAHWLYWPVWFKRNGHRFWAVFLEKFGTPSVKGSYPVNTSEADQTKLLQALAALRRDSAMIFPEGMQIELIEAMKGGTVDHAAFVEAMNKAILVAAIGQTASTSGTPGKLGNDQNQGEVRMDIVRADADLLSASFNASVARWLTEWNFPGAAVPGVWRIIAEAEDLKARSERDTNIYGWGYKPTLNYIQDIYGGEWEDAPAAPANVQPNPALSPDSAAPVAFAEAPADPMAPLTDQLSTAAAPTWTAMLDQIQAEVDRAPDLATLQTRLTALYGGLDTADLVKLMSAAFALAELKGMAEVQDAPA